MIRQQSLDSNLKVAAFTMKQTFIGQQSSLVQIYDVKSVKRLMVMSKQILNNKINSIRKNKPTFVYCSIKMYLINTEQREHLKLLRENSPEGI